MAVETLRSLLQQVRRWPIHMLPTVQQAAMNLVRGIAAATPEETVEGAGDRKPDEWWYRERHHGLRDVARSSSNPPKGRTRRREDTPVDDVEAMSDSSHRRRRLLAEHMHGGT